MFHPLFSPKKLPPRICSTNMAPPGYSTAPQGHSFQRSYSSASSIRSGVSNTSRRVGGIDNNVMTSSTERSRTRRERTFVGSECAVCEEPLEHTLRGERILQFSCSHVSHGACFYEFIKEFDSQYCPTCDAPLHLDTSRGGNVIDIGSSSRDTSEKVSGTNLSSDVEKISNMVRGSGADSRSMQTPTPTWETQTVRPPSLDSNQRRNQQQQQHQYQQQQQQQQQQFQQQQQQQPSIASGRESAARGTYREREGSQAGASTYTRHGRSDSEVTGMTGIASSVGYPETTQSGPPPRRHDYDVQAMETTPGSPRPMTRNPITAPSDTVRSEFPSLSRSRQQQTLACLITVEVPDNKWRPDPEDLGAPATQTPSVSAKIDDVAARPPSPSRSVPRFHPYESPEVLEEMTESLRNRVDNWHGLDFVR